MNSCPVAAGFVSGSITRMPNANVIYVTSLSFLYIPPLPFKSQREGGG